MPELPIDFTKRMQNVLLDNATDFFASLKHDAPISLRYNSKKIANLPSTERIPWCKNGFYLDSRPSFTLDPLFHAGTYYVQEASSMLIEQAIKQIVEPNKAIKVLDLCAAPGGKSTHILDLINDKSLLVSNEVIGSRVSVLQENLLKWGYSNSVVTNLDPKIFGRLEGFFDVILVDAPCSGEGLFRKDPKATKEWSLENANICAMRQNRIIADVMPSLKEAGFIIYSTCTYNPAENMEQIVNLCELHGFQSVKIKMDPTWNVTEMTENNQIGYQCYPHLVKGEGFFLSLLQKHSISRQTGKIKKKLAIQKTLKFDLTNYISDKKDWSVFEAFSNEYSFVDADLVQYIDEIISHIPVKSVGTNFILIKGKDILPTHSLALSVEVSDKLPRIELDLENTLQYLRKNEFETEYPGDGFNLVCYPEHPWGWVKATSGRFNNKLPSEYRIRNL